MNKLAMTNGIEDGNADFDPAIFGEWSSSDKERVLQMLNSEMWYWDKRNFMGTGLAPVLLLFLILIQIQNLVDYSLSR
jgi:hypothetical protein